jgi:FlaA1/EpsC-like NDP-sugar epimerase
VAGPAGPTSVTLRAVIRVAVDLVLLLGAFGVAYLVRFDWRVPPDRLGQLWAVAPLVVAVKYVALRAFGATRHSWRYTSLRDITAVAVGAYCAAAVIAFVRTLGPLDALPPVAAEALVIPYGVIAIDFGATILMLGGARVVRRAVDESRHARGRRGEGPARRAVLVGAGAAGVLVLKELRRRPDLGITPAAFVDDDPAKRGRVIHSLRVTGPIDDLDEVVRATGADTILITIAQPRGTLVRRVAEVAESLGVTVRTIPGLYEVVEGHAPVTQLRPVQIEDLLRREPVTEGSELVNAVITGATVLVTGAGGSIGSELCRQLVRESPQTVILLERAEHALYEIHRELTQRDPDGQVELVPTVVDITDVDALRHLVDVHRPDIVFHAAAHKHVPMMEALPVEAAKNNVLGTAAVVDACLAADVPRFVMISTDKAVNPTSVMGATKRVAERYVQQAAHRSGHRYVAVRFGNVLGSNGSVVPVFQRQIEAGGPVTVTHPEMRRYFMTIPEACKLVMEAGAMADGGEVFVLDMGEPVKIVDLARDLIRLSGLRPDEDIAIAFVGMRPGEKLFEELGLASEQVNRTAHPRINRWATAERGEGELDRDIALLRAATLAHDGAGVRALLRTLVPEFDADAPTRQVMAGSPGGARS